MAVVIKTDVHAESKQYQTPPATPTQIAVLTPARKLLDASSSPVEPASHQLTILHNKNNNNSSISKKRRRRRHHLRRLRRKQQLTVDSAGTEYPSPPLFQDIPASPDSSPCQISEEKREEEEEEGEEEGCFEKEEVSSALAVMQEDSASLHTPDDNTADTHEANQITTTTTVAPHQTPPPDLFPRLPLHLAREDDALDKACVDNLVDRMHHYKDKCLSLMQHLGTYELGASILEHERQRAVQHLDALKSTHEAALASLRASKDAQIAQLEQENSSLTKHLALAEREVTTYILERDRLYQTVKHVRDLGNKRQTQIEKDKIRARADRTLELVERERCADASSSLDARKRKHNAMLLALQPSPSDTEADKIKKLKARLAEANLRNQELTAEVRRLESEKQSCLEAADDNRELLQTAEEEIEQLRRQSKRLKVRVLQFVRSSNSSCQDQAESE